MKPSTTAQMHNPGGRTLPMLPGMSADALFVGRAQEHRLWLLRRWGAGPFMLSLGMNPSVASHLVDDATIRRDIHFAKREGLAAFYKVNAGTYRATNQDHFRDSSDPCHPDNLAVIRGLAERDDCGLILIAYGIMPRRLQHLADAAVGVLQQTGKPLMCLGLSKDGHPKHPLYLKGDTPLIPYQRISSPDAGGAVKFFPRAGIHGQ